MIKNKLCPICNYEDYYDDCSLEDSIGIVEEYSYCPNCGYRYMMSYSDGLECFDDKDSELYFIKSKGAEHHRKVRSKIKNIEHIPIDPEWIDYI